MIVIPRVISGEGLFAATGQIWAIIRAEIAMQWRRWGLWLTFALVASLLLLLTVQAAIYLLHLPPTSIYLLQHYTSADLDNLMIYNTATYSSMLLGLVAALLVVDRMSRDQCLGMSELQRAMPQGYLSYVLGKLLGNYVAMLVPAFLAYLLCALVSLLLGWFA